MGILVVISFILFVVSCFFVMYFLCFVFIYFLVLIVFIEKSRILDILEVKRIYESGGSKWSDGVFRVEFCKDVKLNYYRFNVILERFLFCNFRKCF